MVVLLGLALCVAGLTGAWSHLSLRRLTCERRLPARRAFPGDRLELTLRVENRKLLPMPWLVVRDALPAALAPEAEMPGPAGGAGRRPEAPEAAPTLPRALERSASLLWYSAVSWKCRLLCRARGYYPLGPLTLSSGDIFGLYPRSLVQAADDVVIVYPRLFPLEELGIPALAHLGDATSPRRMFEDPSRTIGVRAYSPGDSLRRIHWKASARHTALQVRIFEPTTDLKVAVFLAVDTFAPPASELEGAPPVRSDCSPARRSGSPAGAGTETPCEQEVGLELGISTAASLAAFLVEHGFQVGLWANSRLADSARPARVPPGAGVEQLAHVLEALAKITPERSGGFQEFLEAERADLPFGSTLLFVVGEVPAELGSALAELRATGHRVLVFPVGDGPGGGLPAGVEVHRVGGVI